tara:strand:+ start:982 stop:1524 length:543 start_codon:yes stop_codon:yes gene_type:complete
MIQQLMFGQGGFNAQTDTGQFVYIPNPHGVPGPQTTLNYTAAEMTTWFNNRSLVINQVPQSSSGTLTVGFNFTVPSGYTLYLVVRMSNSMNSQYSRVYLNGSSTAFKYYHTCCNFAVANANTTITEMKFTGNVFGSSQNDGWVAEVGNFVLVPTGSTVQPHWLTEADFTSNVPGAIITGA